MSKSTLDSLEKLLVKFISPLDQKLTFVMKELKKLEDKIELLDNKSRAKSNIAGSNNISLAIPVPKSVTHTATSERHQRTREVARPTHVSTTPTTGATPPAAPAPSNATLAPAPSVSQRTTVPAVTPLCRPPPTQPLAPPNQRSNDANKTRSVNDDDEWHVVKYKTNRPPRRAVVTGKGLIDSELKTVERVRKIHVCFFEPETTPESIITYMNKKNPNTSGYQANKLKLAHSYYSSFSITVPCSHFNFFMAAENWPSGTEIREWFRSSTGRARGTSTQAPWHGASYSSRHTEGSRDATDASSSRGQAPAATASADRTFKHRRAHRQPFCDLSP